MLFVALAALGSCRSDQSISAERVVEAAEKVMKRKTMKLQVKKEFENVLEESGLGKETIARLRRISNIAKQLSTMESEIQTLTREVDTALEANAEKSKALRKSKKLKEKPAAKADSEK